MIKLIKMLFILCLALALSVPSILAMWHYASSSVPPTQATLSTHVFEYKEFKGVYIKAVTKVSEASASVQDNGKSIPAVHTTTVTPGGSGGSVTYRVLLHNNTDVTYWYVGTSIDKTVGQNALIGEAGGITVTTKDRQSDSSATFDRQDWLPPKTEREIYVTYTYGANAQRSCQTKIEFKFDIKMDAVHDEFLAVLNDKTLNSKYDWLAGIFDSQYAENGKVSISTETHPEVFAQLFDDLTVNIDGQEKKASVTIRRENLDGDASSGDAYSGSGPSGCEYTLYITVESLTPGTKPTVYAIAYSEGAAGMGENWYQVGELYEGTAPVKADGSIDYENWKAVHKSYEIADGIEYLVGAPNGDQYDIMNTMEQLISAVDQDIFNQIDNTNIFKKVYDIIQKHNGSADPAIIGLRQAFEDASIFYKNFNNGQEFKVVRDRYTRAEIIYALQNIQQALDYYYEAGFDT